MKKYHFQSELDNLEKTTINKISDYTQDLIPDSEFFKLVDEYEDQRRGEDKLTFLEDLGIDLNLKQFNLTDIQEYIVAYMFINDLFSKDYTEGIMQLLDDELL